MLETIQFYLDCQKKGKTMIWAKDAPTEEGWYWVKYKNKRNTYTVCPAEVFIGNTGLKGSILIKSARNDTFISGPNHGGPGFRCHGVLDKTLRFGDNIPEPDL